MKIKLMALLAVFALMITTVPQVSALNIQIDPNGKIEFYSGSVLGDEDRQDEKEDKQDEKEDNHENEVETADQNENEQDENEVQSTKTDDDKFEKMNRVRSTSGHNRHLSVEDNDGELKVEIRDKVMDKLKSRKIERVETEDIDLRFPAQVERKNGDEESDYLQEIRAQRAERSAEMVQLKNKAEGIEQRLELRSRNAIATLKNGAEFNLDPVTNEVTIVTPAGEEHVLNHLPDQAITRMEEAGLFVGISDDAQKELAVETNDRGELVYTKKDKIERKLFGLFPRQIDSKIILNDATGEVTEMELIPSSIFARFFNAVSF